MFATIHNVSFCLRLMRDARAALIAGRFDDFHREFQATGATAGSSVIATKRNNLTARRRLLFAKIRKLRRGRRGRAGSRSIRGDPAIRLHAQPHIAPLAHTAEHHLLAAAAVRSRFVILDTINFSSLFAVPREGRTSGSFTVGRPAALRTRHSGGSGAHALDRAGLRADLGQNLANPHAQELMGFRAGAQRARRLGARPAWRRLPRLLRRAANAEQAVRRCAMPFFRDVVRATARRRPRARRSCCTIWRSRRPTIHARNPGFRRDDDLRRQHRAVLLRADACAHTTGSTGGSRTAS